MTIFVDASAAVAMLALEEDADDLFDRLDEHDLRLWSGIARWETAVAFARIRRTTATAIARDVDDLAGRLDFRMAGIAAAEAEIAVEAFARFGKTSGHPARLNMGDCFAYACARTNHAALLYKGDDFALTDLA